MTPEQFAQALEEMDAAGFVRVRRRLGTWTAALTSKGVAALRLFGPDPSRVGDD